MTTKLYNNKLMQNQEVFVKENESIQLVTAVKSSCETKKWCVSCKKENT